MNGANLETKHCTGKEIEVDTRQLHFIGLNIKGRGTSAPLHDGWWKHEILLNLVFVDMFIDDISSL